MSSKSKSNSTFNRQVHVGRVVLVTYGPHIHRLAVIVDIIDHSRALVHGPTTGVPRHSLAYRRMALTPISIPIPRGVREKTLKAVLEKEAAVAKFEASAWGRKMAQRKTRASLTDLDRFKLMRFKKQRREVVNRAVAKLRKA